MSTRFRIGKIVTHTGEEQWEVQKYCSHENQMRWILHKSGFETRQQAMECVDTRRKVEAHKIDWEEV